MATRGQQHGSADGAEEPPLTDEEIRYARQLIQQDRNQQYVVRMLRAHAPWVFVVVGGIVSGLYWLLTHVTLVKP